MWALKYCDSITDACTQAKDNNMHPPCTSNAVPPYTFQCYTGFRLFYLQNKNTRKEWGSRCQSGGSIWCYAMWQLSVPVQWSVRCNQAHSYHWAKHCSRCQWAIGGNVLYLYTIHDAEGSSLMTLSTWTACWTWPTNCCSESVDPNHNTYIWYIALTFARPMHASKHFCSRSV
jgi:hypothetical protein